MSEVSREYRRANSLANWSYIGILIPILGIVLGCISRSIIRGLPQPEKYTLLIRFKSVYTRALWGVIISSILLVISVVASGFGTYIVNKTIAEQNTTIEEQQTELARADQQQEQYGQLILSNMQLKEDYDKLANDYNNLRNAVLNAYR